MILDDNSSDKAGAKDKAKDVSSDVDNRRVKRNTRSHNTFAISELASRPTESINLSSPWYDIEEGIISRTLIHLWDLWAG